MSWQYTIDRERDVVLITATGVLTADDLLTGVAKATRDPDFHPDIRILIDYLAVTDLKFSARTVETMAGYRIYSAKSRRAFLVTAGFAAGIFEYYRTYVTAEQMEVFLNRAPALAWLNEGMPPEKVIT